MEVAELFSTELEVRDYECDLEGIVNNAVYMNYLEHARHTFLREQGFDFATLAREGINLVVVRAELDYLFPLRSGDHFRVALAVERKSRLRFAFRQWIERLPDRRPILRATIIGTAINHAGRPFLPATLAGLLEQWSPPSSS